MSSTTSPNMSLIVPGVGNEAGPTYAQDINADLSIIDAHSHVAGSGVQITPAAININASLTLNNQLLTNIKGLTLYPQGSAPAVGTIYQASTGFLWYKDANGTDIQITNVSGVNSGAGSINNLPFGTAAANYLTGSSTFQWLSATATAANMDFGAAIMRNLSPNSTYAVTLQPPASLGANYSVTLPALPGATSFMSLTSAGVMGTSVAVSGGITTANISGSAGITGGQIAAATITASNIASGTITGTQIAATTIAGSNIANTTIAQGKLTFTPVETVNSGFGLTGGGSATTINLAAVSTIDTIGTYAMATYNGTASFGSDVAGANLRPCSADGANDSITVLSGTWRCMGRSSGAFETAATTTLWLRVS